MKKAAILIVLSVAASSPAEETTMEGAASLRIDVPTRPLARDVHTRLLASFDSRTKADPDFARGVPYGQGNHVQFDAPGKFGFGLGMLNVAHAYGPLSGDWQYLKPSGWYFAGGRNLPGRMLTVEFWVRSRSERNIWLDEDDHYFVNMPCHRSPLAPGDGFDVALLKLGESKRLELRLGDAGRLSLPVAKLDAAAWHYVVFSWDLLESPSRMWLAVDGDGVAGVAPGVELEARRPQQHAGQTSGFEGPGERGIDLGVGCDVARVDALHDEQDHRAVPVASQRGQLVDVAPTAGRRCVGKPGNTVLDQRDRFNLDPQRSSAGAEEQEVEPTAASSDLPAQRPALPHAPDPAVRKQRLGEAIGPKRIDRYPRAVPAARVHELDAVTGPAPRPRGRGSQPQTSSLTQQLAQSAGIRQMGFGLPSPTQRGANHEPIRPRDEPRRNQVHRKGLSFQSMTMR
jgi:hypothetical protein